MIGSPVSATRPDSPAPNLTVRMSSMSASGSPRWTTSVSSSRCSSRTYTPPASVSTTSSTRSRAYSSISWRLANRPIATATELIADSGSDRIFIETADCLLGCRILAPRNRGVKAVERNGALRCNRVFQRRADETTGAGAWARSAAGRVVDVTLSSHQSAQRLPPANQTIERTSPCIRDEPLRSPRSHSAA